MFPGSLQAEQKIGSWREAIEIEMNLKHSEGYHKTAGRSTPVRHHNATAQNAASVD